MADITNTGTSEYATGAIDSATPMVDLVTPHAAKHINGITAAIIQIQTILGIGPTLKGALSSLASRLAVALNPSGQILLTGFQGLTTDRWLLALSSTSMGVMNHTPTGVVLAWTSAVAPTNWLLCDGSEVSRTTYSKLFNVVGTQFGVGNGSTTFNVPDLRGRTIIMVDGAANRITAASTGGASADTLGGSGGAQTHTLTTSEIPAHAHNIQSHHGDGASPNPILNQITDDTGAGTTGNVSTDNQGGGGAHSNTQPWLALNYIIFANV
jgi:microcystin-dependent protein